MGQVFWGSGWERSAVLYGKRPQPRSRHCPGRSRHITRTALTAAVVIVGYWFAYLHTRGGLSLSSIVSTLLVGTIYAVPITYIWLRQGLETAMGFHVWQDFVRWSVAYLISLGRWFS